MNMYDVLLAKKLSGSGGGGGSCPVETAKVTLADVGSGTSWSFVLFPFEYEDGEWGEANVAFAIIRGGIVTDEGLVSLPLPVGAGETVEVPIYILAGEYFLVYIGQPENAPTVDGGAELVTIEGEQYAKVTGDCTITVNSGGK